MNDRPALNRWWRAPASAVRRLLVGPEPSNTLLGSVVMLLPRRWGRLLTVAGMLLLVVLGAADWAELSRTTVVHRLLPVGLLAAAHAVPVALAPRRPLLAWRISLLATVLAAATAPPQVPEGLPWPPVVGVLHLLVLVQLAAAAPRAVALMAAAVDGAAMAAMMAGTTDLDLGLVQGSLLLIALVTGLGISAGGWRATSGRLTEQRRRIVEEQGRRALVEERHRIARELHDVVAHHLSLIAVRAETAPFRAPGMDSAGREELAGIADEARSALVDMRRLLGVLRREDAPPARAPQPQLADLPELIASARASGMAVRMTADGQPEGSGGPGAASPAVGLTAYRLVQEALTNASRHAPGAVVHVHVHHLPGALRVRVCNAAPDRSVSGAPAAGGAASGQGLTGMRERVGSVGGTLTAGPTSRGGFEVEATLPWEAQGGVEVQAAGERAGEVRAAGGREPA